jgi:hypothetical protein
MSAESSSGNPSEKRVILPGFVKVIFHQVRMYWLFEGTLLLVGLYGLIAGWSTPRQWSDVLFYAALAQMLFAWIWMQGSSRETADSAYVRYVPGGDISRTRQELVVDYLRKETFGFRAFMGALLTLVIAFVILKI